MALCAQSPVSAQSPVIAQSLVSAQRPASAQTPGSAQPGAGPTAAGGSSQTALQNQAALLASRIQAQRIQVDQMAEQADAALIHQAQATAALAAAQAQQAATDRDLALAQQVLRHQALAAYLDGGQTAYPLPPRNAGDDPALIAGYADVVANGQDWSVSQYRILRRQLTTETAVLTEAKNEAASSVTQLQTDRQAATAAVTSERATLTGISGQLATFVTAAVQSQAQSQADQVRATLRGDGQLPANTPVVLTAAPVAPPPAANSTSRPAPQAPTSPPTTAAHRVAPTTPAAPHPTAPPATAPPATAPPATAPPATAPPTTRATPAVPRAPGGAGTAIAYAEAQIGKPYQWGGAGPSSFDCSGLVMRAWGAAGVSFPHLAQSQYEMTSRTSIGQLQPGDLVFFGTPNNVYHVGIYVGGGQMVDSPNSNASVRIESIYWGDLLGGGRV